MYPPCFLNLIFPAEKTKVEEKIAHYKHYPINFAFKIKTTAISRL